jgi:hypothetical protein
VISSKKQMLGSAKSGPQTEGIEEQLLQTGMTRITFNCDHCHGFTRPVSL